jgi:ribokinase
METPQQLLKVTDVLVLNETELSSLSGVSVNSESSDESLIESMKKMKDLGVRTAVVATLGSKGVLALVGDKTVRVPGYHVNAVDTTGAGDCFVGCLSAELASGSTIEVSIEFANAGAALSVQVPGAGPSMPKRGEIEKLLSV